MTEYDTEWSSHLLKCFIICSVLLVPNKEFFLHSWCPARNVMSWYDLSRAAMWKDLRLPCGSLCVWCLLIFFSSSTLPPITGRGPASVNCDAPSLVHSSDPRFVLHLGKKRQHAGDSAVDYLTSGDWRTSVFLRLYTRSDPGCWRRARWWCAPCPLLRALSQEGECAWKTGHSPPHWCLLR